VTPAGGGRTFSLVPTGCLYPACASFFAEILQAMDGGKRMTLGHSCIRRRLFAVFSQIVLPVMEDYGRDMPGLVSQSHTRATTTLFPSPLQRHH
jgi:hypothetical protein